MKNRLVYISAPYRSEDINQITKNINEAESYARMALDAGYHPITPHSITPSLFGTVCTDEEAIVSFQQSLIDACSMMFICGTKITPGMEAEILYCEQTGKPVEALIKGKPIKTYEC